MPWGKFTILSENKHCVKKIEVFQESISFNYRLRSEHWIVVEGIAKVEIKMKFF